VEAKVVNSQNLKHKEITDKILHAFFKIVYPALGIGFPEKVYENAMVIALRQMGLKVEQHKNYNGTRKTLINADGHGFSFFSPRPIFLR